MKAGNIRKNSLHLLYLQLLVESLSLSSTANNTVDGNTCQNTYSRFLFGLTLNQNVNCISLKQYYSSLDSIREWFPVYIDLGYIVKITRKYIVNINRKNLNAEKT